MRKRKKEPLRRKIVLGLPDHAKSAVLNTLSSPSSRRNYKFAMAQFMPGAVPSPIGPDTPRNAPRLFHEPARGEPRVPWCGRRQGRPWFLPDLSMLFPCCL